MTGRILTLNAGSSSIKFSLFEAGDRGSDREDDLLDTFGYGITLALGNSEGGTVSLTDRE
jgi:acetate kinase